MKIKCNHFNGKNTTFLCELCKYYHICTLYEPTTKNHLLLLDEIKYWLIEYNHAKDRLKEYETILNDILNHDPEYSGVVNVYGSIKHYPKQNVFGVFIRKPEHVRYGWNYDKLVEQKDYLLGFVRRLNRKELNMRKILEKNEVL